MATRQNPPSLRSRALFTLEVSVSGVHPAGGPDGARRHIADVPGGSFAGERLSGTILPGGTDWLTERGDGALLLDARIVLRTSDDALIAMAYTGIRHGPPEVMARLARGEDVSPEDYYFRIVPDFATSDARYAWLNTIVAVGVGHRRASGPIYEVYEVL
jgi:hypothetical protein